MALSQFRNDAVAWNSLTVYRCKRLVKLYVDRFQLMSVAQNDVSALS